MGALIDASVDKAQRRSSRPGAVRVRGRLRLATQMWLALMLPIALSLGAYGVTAHHRRHNMLMGEARAELRSHSAILQTALVTVPADQKALLTSRVEALAQADRILGLAIFDSNGQELTAGGEVERADALASVAARTLSSRAPVEEVLRLGKTSILAQTFFLDADAGPASAVAVIVRDIRYIDELTALLDRGLVLSFGVIGLLLAAVTGALSRAVVGRPAGAILEGAERVARGDLGAKVPEIGAVELWRLARAFNAMTDSLAEARARAGREEAARLAMERKLNQSHALMGAGQVAASIGHEIGSPLNVVMGRARRSAARPNCPPEIREELEIVAQQSERISRIVGQLIKLARPASAGERECDAVAIIRDVLAFLAPELRHRHIEGTLDTELERAPVPLDGDRLFQVIFNLCWNSIGVQPDGGVIRVSVAADAERVHITVQDAGPGVPEEDRDHVFEPFFSTKRDAGGSGLGLTIVEGLLREVGGTIALEPSERGARFTIHLPHP